MPESALTMLDRLSIKSDTPAMNKLTNEKRVAVVKALVEGMSIRATVRMTGVAKNDGYDGRHPDCVPGVRPAMTDAQLVTVLRRGGFAPRGVRALMAAKRELEQEITRCAGRAHNRGELRGLRWSGRELRCAGELLTRYAIQYSLTQLSPPEELAKRLDAGGHARAAMVLRRLGDEMGVPALLLESTR